MKKVFTYIFFSALVFVYVLSYVGFGIHTCTCSGTTDVILLFNNLSCEDIHAHIHLAHQECEESGHHHQECTHHSTDKDGCCHTEIMVLTDAQDNRCQTDLISVDFQTLNHIVIPEAIVGLISLSVIKTETYIVSDPEPYLTGRDILSGISLWRL